MNATGRIRPSAALAAAAALSLAASAPLSAQQPPARHRVTLPPGTVIPVKLDEALGSKTSRPGDRFTATVRYGRDDAGLPQGTRVEGVVREALPSGDGKPGVLDVDFRRIAIPGQESRPLDASLVSLDAKSVKRGANGRLVASTDKSKDRLKFVGIGAGAGLLIAALTKQNTIASVLLGAGGGYLANELTNKKPGDVNLKSGTEFGVRLDQPISFVTDRPDYDIRERMDNGKRDPDFDDKYYRPGDNRTGPDRPGDVGVLLDDRDVRFGSDRPYLRGRVPMVPFDAVAKAANVPYRYDADSRTIVVRDGQARLAMGSRVAIVNGERRRLDTEAEMRHDVLYVPMEFVAMAVHGSAYWDEPSRTVVVTTHARRDE